MILNVLKEFGSLGVKVSQSCGVQVGGTGLHLYRDALLSTLLDGAARQCRQKFGNTVMVSCIGIVRVGCGYERVRVVANRLNVRLELAV